MIAEEISRGEMGVVYRATDTRLNRGVALKVLPADLVADTDRKQRFMLYLAQIAERQGDRTAAREYYARFLRYWKDGDIDRDMVAEATRKLGSL